MALPDEGYAIPDDEWQGITDPVTGENFYPDDPFAPYRLELIRYQMDEPTLPVLARSERLERLKKLRELALYGERLSKGEPKQEATDDRVDPEADRPDE